MKSQEASLRLQPDIVIATPGRLIDHIHNSPSFTLQNIEILVLDEADRYARHSLIRISIEFLFSVCWMNIISNR